MKPNPLLPKILIVTADSAIFSYLKEVLQLEFQIFQTDAIQHLEFLKKNTMDLILVDDTIFPPETLLPVLKNIRKNTHSKKTPLLLITSNLKKSFIQSALQSGVSDFINKPLVEELIEQRIAVAFQSFQKNKNVMEVAKRATSSIQSDAPSLANRKLLNDQAIKAIAKARKDSEDISLLMIEIDTSQKANTSIDSLLLNVSGILQKDLRKNDILIPQSATRFVLLLPKTSGRAAHLIAEILKSDIEEAIFPFSISIGLISWSSSDRTHGSAAEEFDHLVNIAQQAVSEAHKTGNRIIKSSQL